MPSRQDNYDGAIHCVTTWSKFDMHWSGVSLDALFEIARPLPSATHVLASSSTGYTTNLPLDDVTGGKAWVAFEVDGAPLARDHGGPGAAARAAPLLLEERQVRLRYHRARPRRTRILGGARLPRPRRPVARAALPGRLTHERYSAACGPAGGRMAGRDCDEHSGRNAAE